MPTCGRLRRPPLHNANLTLLVCGRLWQLILSNTVRDLAVGGRLRRPPPFVDSSVVECVVAVQVENFVLPKPAVGTEGQASKISKIEP